MTDGIYSLPNLHDERDHTSYTFRTQTAHVRFYIQCQVVPINGYIYKGECCIQAKIESNTGEIIRMLGEAA
jgi:hypothetical protein